MFEFPRRKTALILGGFFVITAFPLGLLAKEIWDLSESLSNTLPSLFLGFGLGLLAAILLIPGKKT